MYVSVWTEGKDRNNYYQCQQVFYLSGKTLDNFDLLLLYSFIHFCILIKVQQGLEPCYKGSSKYLQMGFI